MTKIIDRDAEKWVKTFIHTCVDKGVSVDKGLELVEQLCVLIQQKRHDEWLNLVDEALKEVGNKEGVSL